MTAMTDENLAEVEQLCQSQDDKPGTHKSQHQAARIIGVSWRSIQRMLKRRLLYPFKRMQTSVVNANARHSRKITVGGQKCVIMYRNVWQELKTAGTTRQLFLHCHLNLDQLWFLVFY